MIIDDQRRKAYENGWRRPWDGPDGEHFRNWMHRNQSALNAHNHESTLPRWVTKLSVRPVSENEDEDDDAKFQFNWVGTENMNIFANQRYQKFEEDYLKTVVERTQGTGAAREARSARSLLSSPNSSIRK